MCDYFCVFSCFLFFILYGIGANKIFAALFISRTFQQIHLKPAKSVAGSWRDLECRYVFGIVRLFYARDPDLQAAFPLTSADFSDTEKVEKFT